LRVSLKVNRKVESFSKNYKQYRSLSERNGTKKCGVLMNF